MLTVNWIGVFDWKSHLHSHACFRWHVIDTHLTSRPYIWKFQRLFGRRRQGQQLLRIRKAGPSWIQPLLDLPLTLRYNDYAIWKYLCSYPTHCHSPQFGSSATAVWRSIQICILDANTRNRRWKLARKVTRISHTVCPLEPMKVLSGYFELFTMILASGHWEWFSSERI